MNRIEGQRRLFQNIRAMEKKIRGGSTTKVTVTSPVGGMEEYTEKDAMEEVIDPSNGENCIKQTGVANYMMSTSSLSWADMGKVLR